MHSLVRGCLAADFMLLWRLGMNVRLLRCAVLQLQLGLKGTACAFDSAAVWLSVPWIAYQHEATCLEVCDASLELSIRGARVHPCESYGGLKDLLRAAGKVRRP